MKKIILIACLAGAGLAQAQPALYHYVKQLNDTTLDAGDLNAVTRVKTNLGTFWAVGDSGRVRRFKVGLDTIMDEEMFLITDMSVSFTLGTEYTLTDVCFTNESHGWIVGYRDTIYEAIRLDGERPEVPGPGRGQIWYTTSGGSGAGAWTPVDSVNMPWQFYEDDAIIPFLSVDFDRNDNQHGYVGCGCGFLLFSDDGGETWYIQEDKEDRHWWEVGHKIGSIPRDLPDTSFYNHYADWYWDVKTHSDGNEVYVASDNNGVFFHHPNYGDPNQDWNIMCFGQPAEVIDSVTPGYGDANVPTVWDADVTTAIQQGDTMHMDTALEILSICVDDYVLPSDKIVCGSITGRAFHGTIVDDDNWYLNRLLGGNTSTTWNDNQEDVRDTCLWWNGVAGLWFQDTSGKDVRLVESAGAYGAVNTSFNMDFFPSGMNRLQWYSYKYALNDVAMSCAGDLITTGIGHYGSLSVGDEGALIWHSEAYDGFTASEPQASQPQALELTVSDPYTEGNRKGGAVKLSVSGVDANTTLLKILSCMPHDRDFGKASRRWDATGAYELIPLAMISNPTSQTYDTTFERDALVGYGNLYRVETWNGDTLIGYDDAGTNDVGLDDIPPEGKYMITEQDGEFIQWPDPAF